jgi:phage-related protein
MRIIAQGVKEIRIHLENEYRIIYMAKFPEAVYILNTFIKKTQHTSLLDIKIAKDNYAKMLKMRKNL